MSDLLSGFFGTVIAFAVLASVCVFVAFIIYGIARLGPKE